MVSGRSTTRIVCRNRQGAFFLTVRQGDRTFRRRLGQGRTIYLDHGGKQVTLTCYRKNHLRLVIDAPAWVAIGQDSSSWCQAG